MKITSGIYKCRKINIPKDIRPTSEKVREAVMSMSLDRIIGGRILDLFAGSGALGLEALSRGAEVCYFNEINRKNFSILKANIANCKAEDKSIMTNSDFRLCIERNDFIGGLDVVFLDPPYAEIEYYDEVFDLLEKKKCMNLGGYVIAEHDKRNVLNESYGSFTKIKEKKYGTIGVDVFEFNNLDNK